MRVLVVNAGSSSLKLRVLDENGAVVATRDLPAPQGPGDAAIVAGALDGVEAIEAIGSLFDRNFNDQENNESR